MSKFARPLLLLAIVSIHPFVHFYANNLQEGFSFADLAGYAAATFAATAALYLTLYAVLRPTAGGLAAGCAIFVMVLFSYHDVSLSLEDLAMGEQARGIAWAALAVFGLVLALTLGARRWFQLFLLLFAAGRLALPVAAIAKYQLPLGDSQLSTQEAYPLEGNDVWSGVAIRRPNIYWLVLDSYPNETILREVFQFDNGAFTQYLTERGFYVAPLSHANFNVTSASMTTALNMEYTYDEKEAYAEIRADYRGWRPGRTRNGLAATLAGDNRVVGFLKQLGYRYVHFDNGRWASFRCRGYEDVCIVGATAGLTELETGLLSLVPYGPLRTILGDRPTLSETRGTRPGSASGTGIPEFARAVSELEIAAPYFVYAHVASPHSPHYNDENCDRVSEGGYTDRSFVSQLRCVNRQMRELLDAIVRDDPQALVVVAGDHGARFTAPRARIDRLTPLQIRERLGILAAFRVSDECRAQLSPTLSPVNFMRFVFACLGGEAPRLVASEHFIIATRKERRDFGRIRRVSVDDR